MSVGKFDEYILGRYLITKHIHSEPYVDTQYAVLVYDMDARPCYEPIEEIETSWDKIDTVLNETLKKYADLI